MRAPNSRRNVAEQGIVIATKTHCWLLSMKRMRQLPENMLLKKV